MNLSKEDLVKLASRTKLKPKVLEKMSKKELVEFLTGVQVDKCSKKKVNQATKKIQECRVGISKPIMKSEDRNGDRNADRNAERYAEKYNTVVDELEKLRNQLKNNQDSDLDKQPPLKKETIADAIRQNDKPGECIDICNTINITPPSSPSINITQPSVPPIVNDESRVTRLYENIKRIDLDVIDLKSKTSQLSRSFKTDVEGLEKEQLRHEESSDVKHAQISSEIQNIVDRVDDIINIIRSLERRDLEFGTRVQDAFANENARLLNENFAEARRAAREEVAELVDDTVSRIALNLNEETRQQAIEAASIAARNVVENSSSIIAAVDSAFQSRLNDVVDERVNEGLNQIVLPEVSRLLRDDRAGVDVQLSDLQTSLSNLESLQINVSQLELSLQQIDNELTSVRDDVRTVETENDASNARIRNVSTELRSTNSILSELKETVADLRNYIDNDVSDRVQNFVLTQQRLAIEQYDGTIRDVVESGNRSTLVRIDDVAQQVNDELRIMDARVDDAIQELRRDIGLVSVAGKKRDETHEERDARIANQVQELFERAREYAKRLVEERQLEFQAAISRMALTEDVETLNATLNDETSSLRQLVNQNFGRVEQQLAIQERTLEENRLALQQSIGDVAVINDRQNSFNIQLREQGQVVNAIEDALGQVSRNLPAIDARLSNVENLDFVASNQQVQLSRINTIERRVDEINNELSRPNLELNALESRVSSIEGARQDIEQLVNDEQNQNALERRKLRELQTTLKNMRDAIEERLSVNADYINNIMRNLQTNRLAITEAPADNERLDQLTREVNALRAAIEAHDERLVQLETVVNVGFEARFQQLQRQISTAVASSPLKRRRLQ